MAKVNLDALIQREDFEVEENISSGKKKETISIEDIKADSFFFSFLRKPDFQRETNEWDGQRICELIKSFIEDDLIPAIDVRQKFEYFLQNYDYLIKQIYEKHRDVQKSYKYISNFFEQVVIHLKAGKTLDDTINQIISSDNFKYLNIRSKEKSITSSTKEFNTNKKSEIYIKEALLSVPRCKICNGLIHRNSISIDHIQRKEDGGLATLDNGQITHPYCNTGYKN